MTRFIPIRWLAGAVTLVLWGCGGGSGSSSAPPSAPAISVTVGSASTPVQAGQTTQVTATVSNDASNEGVNWTVSCPAAPCGSVSPTATASGAATTYTAPPAPPSSNLTVTVTATSVADGTKSASTTITVLSSVSSITVSVAPAIATVQPGSVTKFTATVTNDPANAGVTWTMSCTPAAVSEPGMPCGTLSPTTTASGTPTTYTAPNVGDLVVTLTATSVTNGNASASVTFRVPGISVSVAPGSANVPLGAKAQFTATVYNDSKNQGVTWSLLYTQNGVLVPCPSAAVCGTVSPSATASGAATIYTAPSAPFAGSLEVAVTATSAANSAASAQAFVTIPGITVSVTPSTVSVQARATQQFTASVSNDAANRGVTWTLTQGGTACAPGCGSIAPTNTASGSATTYTAPATPPPSNLAVTVTATSVAVSAASGSATVTVLAITVSVAPGSALLPRGTTQQFSATIGNDPTNRGVTWALTQNGAVCTAPACGALSSTSANPVTYAAPAAISANATLTLTATSLTDTTKSAAARISLSIGTVKIVPDNLYLGRVLVHQSSAPEVTTLTNIASTALSIMGITITGTNASDFSQTNTCDSSVGARATCSITVTFKPTTIGTRTAGISISDSSTDSPQQVSLSGVGYTKRAASTASVRSVLASAQSAVVPSPTGRSSVGTRVLDLVDSTRDDPFAADGSKRELLLRFWYPAVLSQNCRPAGYTSAAVWGRFSQLLGVPLPKVVTNSCLNAPVAEGAHPLVLFTHGYTGTFTDYTFIFEDLASRGYIVASVDHTYEATAVEFPDGRLVNSILGSHLGNWRGDDRLFAFAVSVRLSDLEFVLNELEGLNAKAGSPFAGRFEMSRVALAGHSIGASTALLAVEQEARFRAGIVIDGVIPDTLADSTRTPVLLLAAGRDQWSQNDCHLWQELRGPRFALNLKGGEHATPTDALWLAKGAIKTGDMGQTRTIAAVRDYIAAFLDANLLDKPLDPLLTGPSSEYPDAEVTTQDQLLCGTPQPTVPNVVGQTQTAATLQ